MFGRSKKKAYWIRRTHLFRADEFECSACRGKTRKPFVQCPFCGRKMTKSKYDPSWVDEAEMMDILG